MTNPNLQCQLLSDTLNVFTQKFENSLSRLIRKKQKSVSQQLRSMNIYLLEFKTNLYQWASNLITIGIQGISLESIQKRVIQMMENNKQVQNKHKLHLLLKKKLKKMKKQSFIYSMDQSQISNLNKSHFENGLDQKLMKNLQTSILMMEEDLQIRDQTQSQEHKLGLSSVISRSMYSLSETPIKNQRQNSNNTSVISQYSHYDFQKEQTQRQVDSQKGEHQVQINIKKQIKSFKGTDQDKQQSYKSGFKKEQKPDIQKQTYSNNQNLQTLNNSKKIVSDKTNKKKKTNVYSSKGTNKNGNAKKQQLLGNLLEQSYQSCLQTSNNK